MVAKKNTLPYIILGLLSKSELSGYAIRTAFENEIGEFWQAKHSQIYPELKKMLAADLVTFRTEIVGEKLEKKLYSLTKKGTAVLTDWIQSPTDDLPVSHDEFALKLYFVSSQADPIIASMMTKQLSNHQQNLAHLKARQQLLFSTATAIKTNYGHYLILRRAINRETDYVDWLKNELAEQQKFNRQG